MPPQPRVRLTAEDRAAVDKYIAELEVRAKEARRLKFAALAAAQAKRARRVIELDYARFASGALVDIRQAMAGRRLATLEAQPLLRLWCALNRHVEYYEIITGCHDPSKKVSVAAAWFATELCAEPEPALGLFTRSGGLEHAELTEMFPSRATLRTAFGLERLADRELTTLCTAREWARRAKARQRKAKAEPGEWDTLGERPWEAVGCSRATWFRWSPEKRRARAAERDIELLPASALMVAARCKSGEARKAAVGLARADAVLAERNAALDADYARAIAGWEALGPNPWDRMGCLGMREWLSWTHEQRLQVVEAAGLTSELITGRLMTPYVPPPPPRRIPWGSTFTLGGGSQCQPAQAQSPMYEDEAPVPVALPPVAVRPVEQRVFW